MKSLPKPARSTDPRVARRWSPTIVANGFVPLPNTLLWAYCDLGMSPQELLLVIQLSSFKWGAASPFPSMGKLADRMNMSDRRVREIVASLESKGLIKRERVANKRYNSFDFAGLIRALEQWVNNRSPSTPPTPTARTAA
jgi:hypothetical protein